MTKSLFNPFNFLAGSSLDSQGYVGRLASLTLGTDTVCTIFLPWYATCAWGQLQGNVFHYNVIISAWTPGKPGSLRLEHVIFVLSAVPACFCPCSKSMIWIDLGLHFQCLESQEIGMGVGFRLLSPDSSAAGFESWKPLLFLMILMCSSILKETLKGTSY